jgi:predicted HicB family RNase H-like nuclease
MRKRYTLRIPKILRDRLIKKAGDKSLNEWILEQLYKELEK